MTKLLVVLSDVFGARGGIPRFNQMLCLALDGLAEEQGLETHVIVLGDSEEDYRAAGSPWKHVRGTFVGGSQPATLWKTFVAAARERPDLTLVGLFGMAPAGVAALPFSRRGFGLIVHGYECWRDHELCDRRPFRHWCARRARFALSVSDYTARELAGLIDFPRERIRLLPNTLEPAFETFDAAPPADVPPELLTVSRLWPEEKMKGVDHTIEAFAEIAPRFPDAVYRIVGRGGDKPRLERLAVERGVGERVVFEQDLTDEELASRYRRATAFVLPSGQEGFGIVFLEAMRFSKPCIGGNAGGTPEVIEAGRTGYLVDFGDRAQLVEAIARLLGDPPAAHEMGAAGRRRLVEQFSFERFRQRVAEHLRALT